MKDILVSKQSKKDALIFPQTAKAKKILMKDDVQYEHGFIVPAKDAYKILAWAISNDLTVDSKIEIIVPSIVNRYLPKNKTA